MERGFDDIIKKVYDSGEFEYKPANWNKLSEKLHAKDEPKRGMGLFLASGFTFKRMMAAAVLAMVATSVLYYVLKSEKKIVHDIPSSTVSSSKPNEQLDSSSSLPSKQVNTPISQQRIPRHYSSNSLKQSIKTASLHIGTQTHKTQPSLQVSPYGNENKLAINQVLTDSSKDQSVQSSTVPVTLHSSSNSVVSTTKKEVPSMYFVNDEPSEKMSAIRKGFTLIGGYGKGATNSMYTAGLSYSLPISNHLFIESDVAYYASNIQNVITLGGTKSSSALTATNTPTNGAFSPEDISISAEQATNKHIAFSHLSFNPSIGYSITKYISVKAGIDAQHQITNKDAYGFTSTDEMYKPLPKTDIGFTPKIGFQLSKHWQSNLMYRKAINHLLSSTDYFNRNYFLLQLGYKF